MLLPPDELDRDQLRALELFRAGRSVLVHGAPRSGRTTAALAAADMPRADPTNTAAGSEVIVLAPRRSLASHLQNILGAHSRAHVRVMTPAAFAFALIRDAEVYAGRPEPSLVTGAEQDALLAELISARTRWHLKADPAARQLPGFRTQLRETVTRAGDLGLTPRRLAELGELHARPAWVDAADLLEDYLGVLDLESATALDAGRRLDSGSLVRQAARRAESGATSLPRYVIVDDAQDMTSAAVDLLSALVRAGSQVLVTSSPDQAVESFRGGVPHASRRWADSLGGQVDEVTLTASARSDARISHLVSGLRGRLPLAGAPAATRRRPQTRADTTDDGSAAPEPLPAAGVATALAVDDAEQARFIANALRHVHHDGQVPYDEMAVICRSGAAVDRLADHLTRAGLPVRTPRRLGALRDEQVIADLLDLVEIAVSCADSAADGEGAEPDPQHALRLLRGPFGDADALRLRRVRRDLLDASRHGAPEPSRDAQPHPPADSARLLARALVHENIPGLLPADHADRRTAPVHRLRAMIRAARRAATDGPAQTLWAAWDAAGLSSGWQRAAVETGTEAQASRARLIGRRLDALTALFAVCERFVERRPQADVQDLIDHVRGQAIPEDTLAPTAQRRGLVDVLTPAQLAGLSRDTVVLAGLQEGAWPNLQIRSSVFGAEQLALADAAQHPLSLPEVRAAQRHSVLADELRLAVSAVSRARHRVLVTAVDGVDLSPSALFTAIERAAVQNAEPWIDPAVLRSDPGPSPDARRLVAALRRTLHTGSEDHARDAAAQLALLARAGAPGTDPDAWYHQRPSSTDPLRAPAAALRLSPSALDLAHQCPVAWLLERSGGSRAPSPSQAIGTALHALAQQYPHPTPEQIPDLLAELHARLRPLRMETTWSGRRTLEQADAAARSLLDHVAATPAPLAVEAPFAIDLDGVHLRGSIDRIDGDAASVRVIDFKTGRRAKSARQAEEDLQLAAYQAAVRDGALDDILGDGAGERLSGASLVYVGTGTRTAAVRTQTALPSAEDPDWFDRIVAQVGESLAGAQVQARRCGHCDLCAVRTSCPLQTEGAQL